MFENESIGEFWDSGSITEDTASPAIDMRNHDALFVRVAQVGTLTGDVVLQTTDALPSGGPNTDNWATATDADDDPVLIGSFAGEGASIVKNISDIQAPWARLFYDDTSGTGVLTASAFRKV